MFARLLRFFDTLRRTLGALVFLALLGLLAGMLFASRPSVPNGALLVINPKGEIVEELNTPGTFPADITASGQTRLDDLLRVLRAAQTDERISGLLLDVQDMGRTSLPALQSLGREIDLVRKHGKKVFAYADHYSQTQYYLAAHADEVWLHPMGMVLVSGLSSYRNYFADALNRMHVNIHLFRAGNYKSAAEPLVRNDMSAAAKEETQVVLDQLWQAYKQDIAAIRPVRPEAIQAMLDHPDAALAQYSGDPAALARGMHLVDRIGTHSEMLRALDASLAEDNAGNSESPQINFQQYLRTLSGSAPEGSGAKVGILTASGMITDGQLPGGLNADDFCKLIDKAARDNSIKAVVLRIDSPGGSVQASESIRRALLHLKQSGKPLIVSMGGMAASGGYWIAAGADEIWASPSTLTGSIGVFGVYPDVSAGLKSLGIHNDGVGTTAVSGGFRPDRPLSPAIADVLQAGVNHVYATFLGIVAQGRGLTPKKTAKLAEGRVWSGTDALRLGLVDHLGGLDKAIAAAAKRAALEDDYGVRHIRAKPSLRDRLMERFLGETSVLMGGMTPLNGTLQSGLRNASTWLNLLSPSGGIYAYCGLPSS